LFSINSAKNLFIFAALFFAMTEEITVSKTATKEERYQQLVPQIKALSEGENDLIAVISNNMAALKFGLDFLWVGCYRAEGNELVLGPFQGPVACTRIPFGKGVCGTAWQEKKAIIIADVEQFEGHIACSSESKSEIVLPIFGKEGEVEWILDVDSNQLAAFDETDEKYLQQVVEIIQQKLNVA